MLTITPNSCIHILVSDTLVVLSSGWLVDVTDDYTVTFLMFGTAQFTASVVLFSLPVIMKFKNNEPGIQK